MGDLMDLATSVVDTARSDEGMEVYVTRGTETEVRAYEGAVESLTSADSSGVGIRILLAGSEEEGSRVGFAWAGSLDPAVITAAVSDARDNARYATLDPDVVLATPDAIAAWWTWTCRTTEVASTPMEEKVALAIALERATRGADPRVRIQVSSADYADGRTEVALASTTGIRSMARRTSAFLSVDAIAGDAADTQTGTGLRVGRSPGDLDPDEAMAATPSCAPPAFSVLKRHIRVGALVGLRPPGGVHPALGGWRVGTVGEAAVKGRSFFAGRIGESVANAAVTLVDDPTDRRAFAASSHDGEGLACRRNVLISDGACCGCSCSTPSRRARRQTRSPPVQPCVGGFAGTPSAGCRALVLTPGTRRTPSRFCRR